MKFVLTGIAPIAPAPLHDDGREDEEGMRRVPDGMIDQGVDAICILANDSEPFSALARQLENVSDFKIECPFVTDKLAALLELAGADIDSPFDGKEAVTLLADLDAGATGTMTSALFPEMIRPIVTLFRAGQHEAALAQWQRCLPLINYENRQCGLRACKLVFKEGGVIESNRVRHSLRPLSPRTRERLLSLARDLDIIALNWGQ